MRPSERRKGQVRLYRSAGAGERAEEGERVRGDRGGAPKSSPRGRIWALRPRGWVNACTPGHAFEQGIRPKTL